jgi:uncharacterized membrane protein/mono/diheme cytochrome c family protein
MKQTKTIITHLVFGIQILLVFLLLFESKVQVPLWLQPIGRMHPLLLHLPIGLLVLLALLPLLQKEIPAESLHKLQSFTLHLAALTAAGTALMGFFLAREEGYDTSLVSLHKWLGVSVSFATHGLLVWHNQITTIKISFNIAVLLNVILLIFAGHLGANITHGEDYVLAPIRPKKVEKITTEMPIYAAAIQPVLEKKCYNCHNEQKAKGKLILTSVEQILSGGKHGPAWIAGNAGSSLLLQRIHLPLEHKERMPPQGKPQLSAEEIKLLHTWIQAGARVQQTLQDVKKTDTLYTLVNNIFNNNQTAKGKIYNFKPASEKKVKELNTPFRSVYSVALGSPALKAEIFVRKAYQPQLLQDLKAVQEQLVSLNLTNMPIEDADLKFIAQFKNLEKLILNGTNITGNTLSELKKCKSLQSLGLSGTKVNENQLKVLKYFPVLKNVYIWNTNISQETLQALQKELPNIHFDVGYIAKAEELLQLSPPILKNKSTILEKGELIVLENKLPGVTTRYTTDGTEPDSLKSFIYTVPISITDYTVLKVKNFKPNWKSSEMKTFTFFPKGHPHVQAKLRTVQEPFYETKGAIVLTDNRKGDATNIKSTRWLGFKDQPLDAYFYFDKQPPTVQEIIISIANNVNDRSFPPAKIEVWGGADSTRMQKLITISPKQPMGIEPREVTGIRIPIPKSNFRCYRILARPLARVPDWHYDKQYGARIAVDEVFFY